MPSHVSARVGTSTTTRSRSKMLAPAAFQKQLQAAVAVHCLTWVHTLEQMKLVMVQKKLFDQFHGNGESGIISTVNDCIMGENAFASLWDKNEESSSLTLKTCYTQKEDVIYTAGTSFTVSSLSSANQSTQVLIDGQAIYTLAMNALKNGKKALSFEQSAYKDGKVPSGWNNDDLDDYILDGMWRMLTGAKVIDVEAEPQVNADDEAENEGVANDEGNSDRPESWIFQGWFAYRLFGPTTMIDQHYLKSVTG